MNVRDAVAQRIDYNSYSGEPVDPETRRAVLDAGRNASSARNRQHWRFILVDGEDLEALAELSPSGGWVADADFAVVVCTIDEYGFKKLDAGRALTNMQLVAWEAGLTSRIFTVDRPEVDEFLEIPEEYHLTAVVGFGYPDRELLGRKDRKPLEEVAFSGKFGRPLELE